MHRSQKKNKTILFLLMMFGMFLASCKGPLNLKDDFSNAQKVYITISTNLSDLQTRTVLPTGFNSESTGLTWFLIGEKTNSDKKISYEWNDEIDVTGAVVKSAYYKMTSSDTVIELEEGEWSFVLIVKNSNGKKVLESTLTKAISLQTTNLKFDMKEASGEGVAEAQIKFTLEWNPLGVITKVVPHLYNWSTEEEIEIDDTDLLVNTLGDKIAEYVVFNITGVKVGIYMLKFDLQQQTGTDSTNAPIYETINTYTTMVRVVPGLLSGGSAKLDSLAQLYKIKYDLCCNNATMTEGFTQTSYNKYQQFTLPTPTRSGYTFTGWYTDESCTNKATVDGNGYFSISKDIILYAAWEEVYITNFSKDGVSCSEGVDLEIINSSENTSYGKIVNEIYSQNNIWDKYLRLRDGQFGEDANYSVSLALKADEPTVVAISAARADMYFTVTDKWQEYTFETGFIETALVDNVNAISIGVAKTSGLCIANVTVNKIIDVDGNNIDNGLPTLSFNLGNAPIEYYLEKLPKDDQGLLKPIICVETNNINKGYQITINTKENDDNSDSITVNLRDYVTPGLNMASFVLDSPYSSSIEGYPITNLDVSGTPTKDESKSLKSSIINTWSNSSVKGKEEIQYVAVPVPSDTNVNDPVPYSISGLLKNVKNESSTVTIKNFNIEKISNLENTDKTFAIRVGQNWSKLSDLSEPIQLTSSSDTELQVVLTDNNWESWDNEWKANEYYCQFKVYKAKDSNLRVTAVNGESCKVSGAEKIKLSLADDFTVLIEKVTDTNNDQPSSGGTGGESESNGSSDLKYYAKEGDTAEYLEILTSAGLEKYRDIINGTLTNDIKFSTVRTFNANGSPYAISAKLACDAQVSNWIPIGIPETTVFSFDGQKHSITINNVSSDAGDYAGVFGCAGAEKQNVIIENLIVKGNISSSTAKYSGGIVAYSRGVTIKNCVNYATITNGNTTEGVAGGIIGHAYGSSTINDSVNFAEIQAPKSAGGIVGKSFGYDKWSSSTLLINKCVNIGDIKGSTTNAFVSGVVGHANFTTKIIDCINFGAMTFAEGGLSLNTSGFAWITLDGQEQTCSIANCISVGVPTSYDDMYYAITNYNDNSKGNFDNLYYDKEKWEGKIARDDSVVGVIAKTTTNLCSPSTSDLSDNWSFEDGRYPLPDLSEIFGSSSGEESIWAQICAAAQIQDSASAAVMPSDL